MTKKALIIGLQYPGNPGELGGCVNDAKFWFKTVTEKLGFPADNTRMLIDTEESEAFPSKENIRTNIQWLTGEAMAGDVLFLFFAGHGINVKDDSNDEADGLDEAVVCGEYLKGTHPEAVGDKAGFIRDDEINATLAALPEGVTLYCVFDCCHSGTMLDLPSSHHWDAHKTIARSEARDSTAAPSAISGVKVNKVTQLPIHDARSWFNLQCGVCGPAVTKKEKKLEVTTAVPHGVSRIKADVLALTACRDEQTSIDVAGRGMLSICVEDAFSAVGHGSDMLTLFHASATRCEQFRSLPLFSPPNPECTQYFQFACTPHSNPTLARLGDPIARSSKHSGPQGVFSAEGFAFPLGPGARIERLAEAVSKTSGSKGGIVVTTRDSDDDDDCESYGGYSHTPAPEQSSGPGKSWKAKSRKAMEERRRAEAAARAEANHPLKKAGEFAGAVGNFLMGTW